MKKHQIEVDEEVFEALQELATPLVDTPNSVLRRLLLESGLWRRDDSTIRFLGQIRDSGALRSPPPDASPDYPSSLNEFDESAWTPAPAEARSPYASLGHERRAVGGMSPRRFGKLLVAREFPGEMFERARRERGAFRTMFESEERVVYFLNFNKPGATNLWYKVNATALHALLEAEKPAYVVFTNPAERLAWIIPIQELARAYQQYGDRALAEGDLDVNIDVERDRIRELDWSVEAYRREV